MIKVNILWRIGKVGGGGGGGGNQFLRTLKRYFINKEVYSEDVIEADVILVNSKDFLDEAAGFKTQFAKKLIHRIDGIFSIYRGESDRHLDMKVYDFARTHADGIIFQSEWSRQKSKQNGMSDHDVETVIFNCADNKYFNRETQDNEPHDKTRLVTSSWSSNWKKGFKVYEFLDKNLDFDKYEYWFIGRSPVKFKNIKAKGVMTSGELVKELKASDIFVTATEDDTCSNSVIEALTCGLPVVSKNSGGNVEIVKDNGEIFEGKNDIIQAIERASENVAKDAYDIHVDSIDVVGKKYYDFMKGVCDADN